jgi:hypothetical protein
MPEIDCDQTAIGLPSATSAVFLIAKQFWSSVGVWEEYLDVSATPSGIKREWYLFYPAPSIRLSRLTINTPMKLFFALLRMRVNPVCVSKSA